MNKITIGEIDSVIKDISNTCFDRYGSYSRSCGYFESKLAETIFYLPKTKQQVIVAELKQYLDTIKK